MRFHRRVMYCALSALCMYSMFAHHPHMLDYLCAKFYSFTASTAKIEHAE